MSSSLSQIPFMLTANIVALTADFWVMVCHLMPHLWANCLLQGKNNLDAPWLVLSGFFTLAIVLSLLIYIGEAARDALTQDVAVVKGCSSFALPMKQGRPCWMILNFELYPAQTLAMVGESGSGKSISALALLGLLPETLSVNGKVELENIDLLKSVSQLQQVLW